MVIKNVSLETVCGITSKLPDNPYMEFAFAGKSNVGKSSLINGLMNRKALARTSAQPGKTQTINFYNINDALYFVDLPGYGYAKANEEVKAKFSTICVDTVGIAYDCCEQFICAQNSVSKIGDIPYGGGYSQLTKEFENSLRRITMMGYGLIMTSHLKETFDEEGKLISAKPDLNNRCLKIVNGLVDIIAVITQEWDKNGESIRWVQTRSTPTVTAGTRYRYMAPRIPFGYNDFVKAVADAIDKESENGAMVVDTQTNIYTDTLNFNDIYNEAKEVFSVCNLGDSEFYKAQLYIKQRKIFTQILDYYYLCSFTDILDYIYFPGTIFRHEINLVEKQNVYVTGLSSFSAYEEYWQQNNKGLIYPQTITLKEGFDKTLDYFIIPKLNIFYGIASEKLKTMIEDNGITGLRFEPIEIIFK